MLEQLPCAAHPEWGSTRNKDSGKASANPTDCRHVEGLPQISRADSTIFTVQKSSSGLHMIVLVQSNILLETDGQGDYTWPELHSGRQQLRLRDVLWVYDAKPCDVGLRICRRTGIAGAQYIAKRALTAGCCRDGGIDTAWDLSCHVHKGRVLPKVGLPAGAAIGEGVMVIIAVSCTVSLH